MTPFPQHYRRVLPGTNSTTYEQSGYGYHQYHVALLEPCSDRSRDAVSISLGFG